MMRPNAAFAAYLLAVLIPFLVATAVDNQLYRNGLAYFGANALGLLAYSIVCLQFVLAARFELLERSFGVQQVFRLHKTMAVAAALAASVHVGLLVWLRGNWELLFLPTASLPIQLGRIAGISLLVTLGYSLSRKWIPINTADWRFFHSVLAWIILGSGFAHGISIGSSFESSLSTLVWVAYSTIAVLAWLCKWSSTQARSKKKRNQNRKRRDQDRQT